MIKKFFGEFLSAAILILIGCGTMMGLNLLGELDGAAATITASAAFGMAGILLACTVGGIGGCYGNTAVAFAKKLNKEITWKEFGILVGGQFAGATLGCLLLTMVFWSWKDGYTGQNEVTGLMILAGSKASGGSALDSNAALGMGVMLSTMAEMGMTFLFVFAVLGLTSKKEWAGFAGIGIGLALFGVHLVGIPLTGTSVNPARALSALVFSMFDGNDIKFKALCLIPAILGPFMGAFAAWSAWHGFNKKKKGAEAEEAQAE